ncbi:MAG: GDP-mannose 4,6-dehydratase [Candidatus Rokubacteria bacterium]|nr:GDP-mannose 4,6-dehydratase [Candidatus Rokubacteria bacterium]
MVAPSRPGARVLVTGGAGFVGANLVRALSERGYAVTVLDDVSRGRLEYLDGVEHEFVKGDIREPDLVGRLVSASDAVVHLAAQTGVPGSLASPRNDCELNVLGTLGLLEAVRHAGADGRSRRFVFASSNAPLGRQKPPATEDKAALPISPYGASKLAGEAYCLAYHGSWGLGTVVLRFGNIYGPYCAHKQSVIAKFFGDLERRGRITIEGDGGQTRDFVYVGDLCRAIVRALESDVSGEVFQIAAGVETSIRELAQLVGETVGRDVDMTFEAARQGDIRQNYSAIEKARRVLGWTPETSLRDGLRETWTWWQRWTSRATIP